MRATYDMTLQPGRRTLSTASADVSGQVFKAAGSASRFRMLRPHPLARAGLQDPPTLPGYVRAPRCRDPEQRNRRTGQRLRHWRRVRPDRRGRGRCRAEPPPPGRPHEPGQGRSGRPCVLRLGHHVDPLPFPLGRMAGHRKRRGTSAHMSWTSRVWVLPYLMFWLCARRGPAAPTTQLPWHTPIPLNQCRSGTGPTGSPRDGPTWCASPSSRHERPHSMRQ